MTTKRTSGKLHLAMIGVSATALMHASASFAQESAAPADGYAGLEEIVVTAQKRSENVRDVPISMTVLSGTDISKSGVTSNLDLVRVVPGLQVNRVGGSTIPSIRGISSYLTTVGTDSNVAMYIDNVYVSSQQAATIDLPDISSIEVLKGPQGTLFGRNATGGAIRIFTKSPDLNSPAGDISVSYGNFDTIIAKGFVSAPIVADKLAVSVSGYYEHADSYYTNLNPVRAPSRKTENYSLRGKLVFEPSDDTRLVLAASTVSHETSTTVSYAPLDGITLVQGFPGSIVPTKPWDYAIDSPVYEKTRNDTFSAQLSQNTSIGEFTLLGAYDKVKSGGDVSTLPGAFGAPFDGNLSNVNDKSRAYTAELNFASKQFGAFSFIAGANYFDKSDKWDPLKVTSDSPTAAFGLSIYGKQTTEAYAFFGEATIELTDRLSLIGGLRYSNEKREVSGASIFAFPVPTPNYDVWDQVTFEKVTQRVSLKYDLADRTNVYFTYSTGFKSGNFIPTSIPFGFNPTTCDAANAAAPGSCSPPPLLNPETITAYEVGVKSAPTPWLRFDAALFVYELKQIQIQRYTDVCVTAPCPPNPLVQLSQFTNAAAADMYGAEININAQVTNELDVTMGATLIDATFSSYENAAWFVPAPGNVGMVVVPTQSATGKRLPRAPKATLSVSATYTKDLPAGEFSFTASGYGSTRVYHDVGNVFSQAPYATLGLRASFSPSSVPGLTATLWGNNLTNEPIIEGAILGASGAAVTYSKPRTYGFTLGYNF